MENLKDKLGMSSKLRFEAGEHPYPFLHPGRQAVLVYEGEQIGYMGEAHPLVAESYGIDTKAYLAVIDLNTLQEKGFVSFEEKYRGIANFPAVTRDISLVMKKDVPVAVVEDIIEEEAGKLLESCSLFDLYEGEQIKEGYKSVAFTFALRSPEKTLSDDDINPIMDGIFAKLAEKGFELRK